MGLLKQCVLAVLVLSFALLASGDTETTKTDESKAENTSSSQTTESPRSEKKDPKPTQPPTKESAKPEEKPLERLELDEEIESTANIALPQDI